LNSLSGKHDTGAPSGARTGWLAHHYLNIPAQPVHTLQHLRFADAPKLATQHAGELGLGHAQDLGGLRLRQMPMLDDFANLGGQAGNSVRAI